MVAAFFTGGGSVLTALEEKSPYGLEPVKALLLKLLKERYDIEENDMLSAEDIGITDAEYVAACAESMAAAPEGHVMVAGRRVYAAE